MRHLALVAAFIVPSVASADELPRYQHAAVAADHPVASEAGVEVLKAGGNVIDAAVATAVTLSVVRPASSGLGGGGFMVYWNAQTQEATCYDYRERAPKAARADMFANTPADASVRGPLAIAVPGEIVGLCEIQAKHGRLKLANVLKPALRAARDGVPVDAHDRQIQQSFLKEISQAPDRRERFDRLWKGYLNGGTPWREGDRFYSPQRPALELLATEGAAAFTEGALGKSIVAEVQSQGGILAEDDLKAVAPVVRKPLRGQFRGYDIITMPPPSSGGIALLQTLQVLEGWSQRAGHQAYEQLPEGDRAHLLTEAFKHVFANRAEYLGDADFVEVPVTRLLSREYAAQLASRIDLTRTYPPEHYGRQLTPDDHGTTHFCVMDAEGNAVACTETINTGFGSCVVEPTYGIVLNNQMDDFAAVPGKPNAFGLRQSAANAVAPGKKPLSSMTPTIVLKDGRPVLIAGASGGPRIISATTQVLLEVLLFDRTANAAVQQPRLHHQWQPDDLLLDPRLRERIGPALESRGHRLHETRELGVSQAIRWTPAGLEPASDPRKHGRPAGF